MADRPLNTGDPTAYFITGTSYGTWLPGDQRGWHRWGGSEVQAPNGLLVQVAAAAILFLVVVAELVGICPAAEPPPVGAHGMAVSVCPLAGEAGRDVLRQGGNAVDAAVAMAFALAVTWPAAGNIGGGGFMMVYPGPGQRPVCVEYRETAPAAATPRMFERDLRMDGHKVCGTPGTVAGMELARRTFGTRPWGDLMMPAIRLARDGFVVDTALARSLNGVLKKSKDFTELQRVFAPPFGKAQWDPGDRLVQPDLARTLERIAREGADAFYRGAIADLIVAEMKAGRGLIAQADLAAYRARLREPIRGTYRGFEVFGPPPPSSGGICLVEMLNMLENFKLDAAGDTPAQGAPGPRWSPRTMHLVIETMRRAYCDRAKYLGDPDFTSIPAHLTSKEYARKLASEIDLTKATPSEALAPEIPLAPEPEETTHFSVIDKTGMAVANTYTLQNSYGSRVVVRGAGFLLNNEMTDFNRVPGRTDRKGMIGTPANVIAPGKRMLSSQTPALVCRDGRLVLITGSPGGRTIINTVLCTVINTVDFQMNARQAVDAPRLHHQWFPDRVDFEGLGQAEYAAAVEQLTGMGHRFAAKATKQGDAHSIGIDPQTRRYAGAPDLRIRGADELHPAMKTAPMNAPLRIVALGDSITNGAGLAGVTEANTFREIVRRQLTERLGSKVEVVNAGVNGDIVTRAVHRLKTDVLDRKPHLVTIMFGGNEAGFYRPETNGFADTPRVGREEFKATLGQIVDRLQAAGIRVVLMTCPPMTDRYRGMYLEAYQKHGINFLVKDYAQAMRDVAGEKRVELIDVYRWFEQDPSTRDFFPDGLHPDTRGHRAIADLMVPRLARIIRERPPTPGK